jgi:hypothetical protein
MRILRSGKLRGAWHRKQPPMTLQADLAIAILRAAAASEKGWEVLVHNPPNPIPGKALRAKQILYRHKVENPNEFGNLVIRVAPHDPDNRLWITKE